MPGYNVSKTQLKSGGEGLSKYRCPKCDLLLRDAVQPSCGHWLCLTCAEDLFKESQPHCPRDDCKEELVPEDDQNFFPDRFVRREILGFALFCSNQPHGCSWEGALAKFEDHLKECAYSQETCSCGQKILRHQLKEHKSVCPNFKKPCPLAGLGCSHKTEMTRQELYAHFEPPTSVVDHMELMVSAFQSLKNLSLQDLSDCNLHTKRASPKALDWALDSDGGPLGVAKSHPRLYKTELHEEGLVKGFRKLLPDQIFKDGVDDKVQHMDYPIKSDPAFNDTQMISEVVRKEMAKLQEEVKRGYMAEIKQRDGRITSLEQQIAQLQKSLKTKNAEVEDRDFRLSLIENSNYDGTMIWKIPQFTQRMADARTGKYTSIFSLPFYSSRYGYKMCLRLYIMGDGIGKGTHMSLFFVVMKGEFDNILSWPFSQRVTFRLINQKSGGRDIVDAFQPDPMSSSFKKPKSDMNIASGCPRFITHESLKNGGYLEDDTVFIKCVVDRNAIHHP